MATTIGVCGLGAMGAPLAMRLVRGKQFSRVVLYNRTVAKAHELHMKLTAEESAISEGAVALEVASSMEELAKKTLGHTVIMMLYGDESTDAVVTSYIAAGKALSAAGTTLALPTLFINAATLSDGFVRKLNDMLMAEKSPAYRYVNAAVTGRPEHVAAGQLCHWLSCDPVPECGSAEERVSNPVSFVQNKVAPAYTKAVQVISLTDVTASARYKVCTNFLVYGIGEMLGEAMLLLEANGLPRESVLHWTGNVIPKGNLMDIYANKMVKRQFGYNGETVGASLEVGVKDLRFMKASLEEGNGSSSSNQRLPLLDAALDHMQRQLDKSDVAGNTNLEWCSMVEEMEKDWSDRGQKRKASEM